MVQLRKLRSEFDSLNITLASVSVDSPELTSKSKAKTEADFAFLSDSNGSLMDTFGLRHSGGNAMDGSDISRPAVIVLDKEGKLILSEVTTNYRVRPTAAEILEQLEKSFPRSSP